MNQIEFSPDEEISASSRGWNFLGGQGESEQGQSEHLESEQGQSEQGESEQGLSEQGESEQGLSEQGESEHGQSEQSTESTEPVEVSDEQFEDLVSSLTTQSNTEEETDSQSAEV